MKKHIIHFLQIIFQPLLVAILSEPRLRKGKTTQYYLNRSQCSDSTLGANTLIQHPYHLHSSIVDDFTYISRGSTISQTTIGKFCSIGPNFLCGIGIHPTDGLSTAPMFYSTYKQNGITLSNSNKVVERKPITIGNDVFIGANVTVLDGVEIGDGAIIGAGAIVVKSIPPYAIALGVPAKVVKYRFDEHKISSLLRIKWWKLNREQLFDVERYFFNVDDFIKKYDGKKLS